MTCFCVSGFGYADQRIVRGVRIHTFSALLRQDVAFFDAHTTGELASRINADCGAMAGDLVRRCFVTFSLVFSTPILASPQIVSVRHGSFVFRSRVW
jgi:ABC-type multidrug transport system fused ATPase/permease subunit